MRGLRGSSGGAGTSGSQRRWNQGAGGYTLTDMFSLFDHGALCVEMGFTWTIPRNQDATVKLKTELISIKF